MPKFEEEPIKPMSMQEIVDSMFDDDARQEVTPINPDSPLGRALQEVTIFDLWRHFKLWGNPRQKPLLQPISERGKTQLFCQPGW